MLGQELREAKRQRHRRLVAVLVATGALGSADLGTIGATATVLRHDMHLSTAQVGVLASVASLVGAAATVPMGMLADRVKRVPMLAISVLTWSGAMAVVGGSTSYLMMLIARGGLGLVTAAAGPLTASLIGDTIPTTDRGGVYGHIVLGQLVGSGVGLVGSGEIAGLVGWRWAYRWLAVLSALVGVAVSRLPEPRHLQSGSRGCGNHVPFWSAIRRVLAIRTNVVLIVASAVGYYFFTGVRTFGVGYLRGRFGVSQATASSLLPILGVGAVVGILAGGRLGDRLHGRYANGRIRAALGAYLAAVIVLTTTFLISGLVLTICLATLAAGCLSAVNPPLDAARIDIMPRSLLGRAESVRTLLTSAADVFAPVLFGVLAAHLGLQKTFLVMIGPLIAAGLIGALAVRTYPADAAAAEGHGSRGRQARHPAPS